MRDSQHPVDNDKATGLYMESALQQYFVQHLPEYPAQSPTERGSVATRACEQAPMRWVLGTGAVTTAPCAFRQIAGCSDSFRARIDRRPAAAAKPVSGPLRDRVDDVHRRGGMMARDLSVRVDTMRTVPETDDRLHVHFKNSQSAKGTEAPPR